MLNERQLDALGELASIGGGHAATALSQLVDRKIVITCPRLREIPTAEVAYVLGGPETMAAAIYVRLLGDVKGGLLFVIDDLSARALAGLMRSTEPPERLADADHELLRHAGNMLLSAFSSAVGRATHLSLVAGSPGYANDMVGAVLETVAAETEGNADTAMLFDTDFVEEEERSVEGKLFFLPAPGCLEVIAEAVGVT